MSLTTAMANIITLGPPNGQLKSAFQLLSKLCAKKPDFFSFAIIAGDLFGEEDEELADLLAGKISVPLPTYFTVGFNPLPKSVVEKLSDNQQLSPNLSYLNKRSTFTATEGVKIVVLGGKFSNSGGLSQEYQPIHTPEDAKALKGANTADILLTSQWPIAMRELSDPAKIPKDAVHPDADVNISELCAALRPRYHFSTTDYFFEREPFFHPSNPEAPGVIPFTRFISLAPHGNTQAQKSIFAFTLSKVPATSPPLGTTASPFGPMFRKRKQDFDSTSNIRFLTYDGSHHDKRPRRQDRGPPPSQETCFFCIGNPQFKKHLVTNIADDSYLALPRGPLTTRYTNADNGISFPTHLLICPIHHSPTVATAVSEDSGQSRSEETFLEMTRFRRSLQEMAFSAGKGTLGTVTYEISASWNIHNQWQFIPIDQTHTKIQSSTGKSNIEAAFRIEAENVAFPAFEEKDPGLGSDKGDFFRVWIWSPTTEGGSEGTEKCLTMPLGSLNNEKRFDPQFGRRVLAKLLGLDKRIAWRDCQQTEVEETADADAFKRAFADFDFS